MNYGELKAAVLSDSHRPDLSAEVARFIREAEGMIRRDLRAYPLSDTLAEADRVSDGVYALPTGLLEVRVIRNPDGFPLDQVSLSAITRLPATANPLQYAIMGANIEIRGTPGTDAELPIEYLGHPAALADDADTNSLLSDHESLYIEGALFFLRKHTEDLELAQAALESFTGMIEKLNEATGRKLGGASQTPAYNFGCGSGR